MNHKKLASSEKLIYIVYMPRFLFITKMDSHKYIIDDVLYFSENIEKDISTIMYYIYDNLTLDYDEMVSRNDHLIGESDYDYWDGYNCDNGIFFDGNGEHCVGYHYIIPEKSVIRNGDCLSMDLVKELDQYIVQKNKKINKLKIQSPAISFMNICGINGSTKGIRKLDWKIQFKPQSYVQPCELYGIYFLHVMDSLYDIKSHKFDSRYEEFIGCEIIDCTSEGLNIVCRFNHT